MMDQNACNAVTGHREKWTLWSDAETTEIYGNMARLHTRLQPYFRVLAREANATGWPIMRHPFLMSPRTPEVWAIDDAFFLGPALYAAPVVKRGERVKSTWLPPGDYLDLADRRTYRGGQRVEIPAPLEKLPLLLVSGQILPLLDASIETLAPATDPAVVTVDRVKDRLDALILLGSRASAEIVLADGTVLTAKRDVTDAGNPDALAQANEAMIADCADCVLAEGSRVRVNSALDTDTTVRFGDLILTSKKSPTARRIRWDVTVLP